MGSEGRRSIRLKGFDYAAPGMCFVTVCARDGAFLFGEVINGEMVLNECGQIVMDVWNEIPQHFANVALGAFVVMPNHVHGVIEIMESCVGATHASPVPNPHASPEQEMDASPVQKKHASPVPNPHEPPEQEMHEPAEEKMPASPMQGGRPCGPRAGSLGAIVGAFKSTASRRINALNGTAGEGLWHRNFYEHVIRDEDDLARICAYIEANPARWVEDEENPVRCAVQGGAA